MKREPAVAGYFYPGQREALLQMIEEFTHSELKREKALAVISPHAGYQYSGSVAGAVFSSIEMPEKFILLGPNHREVYSITSVMSEGSWMTPLGEAVIDSNLAEKIKQYCSTLREDAEAHRYEHSLEVQLPFIQYHVKNVSFVPITISYLAQYEHIEELTKAVVNAVREENGDVLIVASTDMSHYVDQSTAKEKDFLAIKKIEELDPEGLFEIVQRKNISMCGYLPSVVAVSASKALGAKKAELIKYQTSGDVTGNYKEVVGYAGMRII